MLDVALALVVREEEYLSADWTAKGATVLILIRPRVREK